MPGRSCRHPEDEVIDLELSMALLDLAGPFGVDFGNSVDSIEFLERQLPEDTSDVDRVLGFVESRIADWFPALAERPSWIQNADWPFAAGRPMTYVGHVDPPTTSGVQGRFFVFWSPETGETETIIQVS